MPLELLAVTERGFLVFSGSAIALVRYRSFRDARLQEAPGVGRIRGLDASPETLEKARKYSRYPFGLSERELASLLADLGQEGLIIL
ncbi:MAG: hypothetical protein ACQET1_12195 [Gemmatimonadota bacterium]